MGLLGVGLEWGGMLVLMLIADVVRGGSILKLCGCSRMSLSGRH